MNKTYTIQYFKIILVLFFLLSSSGVTFGSNEAPQSRKSKDAAMDSLAGSTRSQDLKKFEINEKFIEALIAIESSNDPRAHNKKTGARGLTQITPRAWHDLVRHFPKKYNHLVYRRDIFSPHIAKAAGNDYLLIIQHYLKKKDIPVTLDTVIAVYNWGIGNLRQHGLPRMPLETQQYIKKMEIILASAN